LGDLAHNLFMETSARGGLTAGLFLGTFLSDLAESEALRVSAGHSGRLELQMSRDTYGFLDSSKGDALPVDIMNMWCMRIWLIVE
jgi:hypothetical protein